MFHLLEHTGGTGGTSTFVDGVAAAQALCCEHPDQLSVLENVKIQWHASGNENQPYWGPPRPVVSDLRSQDCMIRWNNADRCAFRLSTKESVATLDRWYEAAMAWERFLQRPEYQFQIQLQPGRPISEKPAPLSTAPR